MQTLLSSEDKKYLKFKELALSGLLHLSFNALMLHAHYLQNKHINA